MDYPKVWCKQSRLGAQQEATQPTGFQGPIEGLTKKQMEKLAKKPKSKQPKLFGSKSLSQLVPRGLFFMRPANGQKTDTIANNVNNLVTTKSFPNKCFRSGSESSSSSVMSRGEPFVNRITSASLLGLPRQSSSSTFVVKSNNSSLEQPNLSPIVCGPQQQVDAGCRENGNEVVDMSWTEIEPTCGAPTNQHENKKDLSPKGETKGTKIADGSKTPKRKANTNNKASGKYRAIKNTTLVLRDVKNSIGLRMKAKHESQAFTKLTEEQATPPTKLYSPFNIYTDSCSKDSKNERKRNMNSGKLDDFQTPSNNKGKQQDTATVKCRIAFQHKKHLMQANKFTFDSPTGKLRETVKDVERFQQCIEDISKAIKARDSF